MKKIPRVQYECCGIKYDSTNPAQIHLFRCFKHENITKNIDATYCITIYFSCINNNCINVFTYYYNDKNRLLARKKFLGIKYVLNLQNVFLENIELKPRKILKPGSAANQNWKYGKSLNGITQNIYNFNNQIVRDSNDKNRHSN